MMGMTLGWRPPQDFDCADLAMHGRGVYGNEIYPRSILGFLASKASMYTTR